MKVRIKCPQSIRGEVQAPGSKAYTHRALLASLLSPGKSILQGALDCDDTRRTLAGIRNLGAEVQVETERIICHGVKVPTLSKSPINCGESGATLRFLTAIASSSHHRTILTANPRLADRPLEPMLKALNELGVSTTASRSENGLELQVQGPLKGGETWIRGDISSQFISGLLFAAPLARKDVTINVAEGFESRPYVNLSIDVLRKHGISIEESNDKFIIPAPQNYAAASHKVPGDFSSAAFLIAGTGIAGEKVRIFGIGSYDLEPDSIILKIGSQIGLKVHRDGDSVAIVKNFIEGFEFDASNNPDLVPALEVLACFAAGSTEIRGVQRLRYKETNRLQSLPTELARMGAKIEVGNDSVKIEGSSKLAGCHLYSHQDHRIAMACAAASLGATGESIIHDAEAVSKSYPKFFQDLAKVGVQLYVE